MSNTGWAMVPAEWFGIEPGVAMTLITMDGLQGQRETLRISHAYLAERLGNVDPRTVKRRIDSAIQAGWVTLVRQSNGKGPNTYRVENPLRKGRSPRVDIDNTPDTGVLPTPDTDAEVEERSPDIGVARTRRNPQKEKQITSPSPGSPLRIDAATVSIEEAEEFQTIVSANLPEILNIPITVIQNVLSGSKNAGWNTHHLAQVLVQSFGILPEPVEKPVRLLEKRLSMVQERVRPIGSNTQSRPSHSWCGECYSSDHRWVIPEDDGPTYKCPNCNPGAAIKRENAY